MASRAHWEKLHQRSALWRAGECLSVASGDMCPAAGVTEGCVWPAGAAEPAVRGARRRSKRPASLRGPRRQRPAVHRAAGGHQRHRARGELCEPTVLKPYASLQKQRAAVDAAERVARHTWHPPPKVAASNLLDLLIFCFELENAAATPQQVVGCSVSRWVDVCSQNSQPGGPARLSNSVPSHTLICTYNEGFGTVRRCA